MMNIRAQKVKFLCGMLALVGMATGVDSATAVERHIVEQFKLQVRERVCKGDRNWLRCYQADPMTCSAITGSIVDSCIDGAFKARPGPYQEVSELEAIAEDVSGCLRESFLKQHGDRKLNTPECARVG